MIDATTLLKQIDTAVWHLRGEYPRPYLGLSSIGKSCMRQQFLTWRFAGPVEFSPRLYRLFERGNLEEIRFVDYLRMSGYKTFEADPETGRQFEYILHHGHVKGHGDAICCIDGVWYMVEMKTHNNSSFNKVRKANNLRVGKYEHFVQLQMYTKYQKLDNGLYMAVNKDNDALHAEFLEPCKMTTDWAEDRLLDLLQSKQVPKGICEDASDWRCNLCNHKAVCTYAVPFARSCRMCEHIEMIEDGGWSCRNKKARLNGKRIRLNDQIRGCKKFLVMP